MKKHSLFGFIIRHILVIVLISLSAFLFFYRLDWQTLGSWDEAWYGSIAREMVKSGDLIHLNWNGKPFFDHPPMGFWIMALSYKIFGISEFSTRLPSALLGVFSSVLIYLIGTKISKEKIVGFASALILGTCVWYVIRVRSGNLDSLFVFFYLLSIYFAVKAREHMKWFPLTLLAFGSLMLTKTLVGASALPVIVFIVLPQLVNIRKNFFWIGGGIALFFALVMPWYWIHHVTYPDFIQHHFFTIGTRNKTFDSYFNLQYELPLFYLHMGIRKWYYLWLISASYLLITLRFFKKYVFTLLLWNAVILYPFLTTDATHIWHLIPVYVPVALIISYALWDGGMMIVKLIGHLRIKFIEKYKMVHRFVVQFVYIGAVLTIVFMQVNIFYHEVIPGSKYTPDDVDISMRVKNYEVPIYLDDDYLPLSVFYSNREIRQMAYEPDERKTLVQLFQTEQEPFVVITRNWALTNLKNADLKFRILESNNSFSIVAKP